MIDVKFIPGAEDNCAVCFLETLYWYLPKDVPVCKACSKRTKHEDVPTKRMWLIELGLDLPPDWRPRVERCVRIRIIKRVRVKLE